MTVEQEKKNRRIALATSLGVHGVILLLLLFVVAWRAPDPPLPEYGIELNFGTAMQGSGAVQPETPAASQETTPEQDETLEDLPVPEPQEVLEEAVVEESRPAETQSERPEVVSQLESPVVVEEKKEVKPVEKPKEKPLEKVVEPKHEEKPQEVPKAVYKPRTTTSTTGTTDNKTGTPANEGNDVNKAGDKGNPPAPGRPPAP